MIKTMRYIFVFSAALIIFSAAQPRPAYAVVPPCVHCSDQKDVDDGIEAVEEDHEDGEDSIVDHIKAHFHGLRDWIGDEFFTGKRDGDKVVPAIFTAMQAMAQNLSAAQVQKTFIVGTFFDAKQQLEARRNFEELKFQAHKDYQPDNGFCSIGTNTRSLASSEMIAAQTARALNRQATLRLTGNKSSASSASVDLDKRSRWERFATTYCDVKSNGWGGPGEAVSGFADVCKGAIEEARINNDVDYTALMENKRTLDVDFTNTDLEADEKDILALGQNLYAHDVFDGVSLGFLKGKEESHRYFPLRSILAKRNVARSSFDAQVAMKSSGQNSSSEPEKTYDYLAAALKDLGMSEADILELIGENPSYYAQLEVLSKKLYQSPNFVAALYDSPTNVKRKAAALTAINLMLERAIFESEMRQETLLSVLLTADLRGQYTKSRAVAGREE